MQLKYSSTEKVLDSLWRTPTKVITYLAAKADHHITFWPRAFLFSLNSGQKSPGLNEPARRRQHANGERMADEHTRRSASDWKLGLGFDAKAHALRGSAVAEGEYSWDDSDSSTLSLVAMRQVKLSTAVGCWLYSVCHALHWQVGTYLDTHTHTDFKKGKECNSEPLPGLSEITFWAFSKVTPIWSDRRSR